MPTTSNPTRRVTAILDLLTIHPHGLSLTEIARELHISKSTCLAILTELTRAGYLVHDALSRRYLLGTALLAAGETAASLLPGLAELRDALAEVSRSCDVVCGANVLAGDELVVVLRVGPPDPLDTAPVGQRVPFVAPYGISLVAWADRATFASWLARCPAPLEDRDIESIERSVAIARRRGFAVTRPQSTISARRFAAELPYLRDEPGFREQFARTALEYIRSGFHLDHIDARGQYTFLSIHAPVATTGPRPVVSPHILGNMLEVPGRTILRLGERLAAAVAEVRVG